MGRSVNDIRDSLRRISVRLDSMINELDSGFGRTAQDEEPAEVGGGDDFADEGTTGEEGGEGEGPDDLGEGGEGGEGGDLGGGDLGGGGGFGGGDLGGGFGEEGGEEGEEDEDAIGGEDPKIEALETTVEQLQTTLDFMERRFITMQEMMQRINDPFSDPARGNNAFQST